MRATALVLGVALTTAGAAHAGDVIVLKAARLFDGRGDTVIRDGVVVVEGDQIREVGSRLPVPDGARVVDLGDATLLPGFIDAHTHVTGEAGPDWYRDEVEGLRRSPAESAVRAVAFARRTLEAGFTTVRNLGASDFVDIALRNGIEAGAVPGPRIFASAYALGARGGHCDATGYPYRLFGHEPGIPEGIASGPDGFRDAVRFQVKYGADVIKVCATGGVLSLADEVDTPQLTQPEMDALVDEAHRLRKRTAAHAHGAEGAKVAIRAGIDSIEHGSFLDDEALRMMKERGTWLVPTALAGHTVAAKAESFPPEIATKARAAARAHAQTLRRAIRMGVPIAFGTDSGVSPHGHNAEEFALLVAAGMSPAAALRAATLGSATLLGIADRVGTLEPGKVADIVAVPGDPLDDVTATERVRFVMKQGRAYE